MIESNRTMIQLSILSALAVLAFGTASVSQAAPASRQKVVASDKSLNPEQLSAQRVLLRYTQLWNLYRFRNQTTMSEADARKVDALIASVQAPNLHSQMPIDDIRAKLRANSLELSKLLTTEISKGAAPEAARATLVYLKDLVRGLSNTRQFAMSDSAFAKEAGFAALLEAQSGLPESMTKLVILVPESADGAAGMAPAAAGSAPAAGSVPTRGVSQ